MNELRANEYQSVISINRDLFSREDAKISVYDHGFLYGDGVFEGIRIYGNNIFRLERHIDRLYRSASVIDLDVGWTKQELIDEIRRVIREWADRNHVDLKANNKPLYSRVVISRGEGDLGLDPLKCPKPNVIVIVDTITLYSEALYENGLSLATTTIRRNSPDSLPPQVKSLNYLNNILAKIDANNNFSGENDRTSVPVETAPRKRAAEAILLNQQGFVAEATADNIFIVLNGELITPPVTDGALPGITRGTVLELAREKKICPCREGHMTIADLFNAEECFLTGTAARVIAVTKIDGRTIGDGKPGAITQKLKHAYESIIKTDGVKVYD